MVATTKEAQRAELQKTIWRIANDLRGSVDGCDFESYVLGTLFYRFISENLAAYLNELEREAGDADFDYAKLTDSGAEFGRKDTVDEKGFYILPSELFANVRKRAAQDVNLNETLSRVFASVEGSAVGAASEDDLKGLFHDLDVNSPKLGPTVAKRNERLVKLLDASGELDFGNGGFTENTIDAFHDGSIPATGTAITKILPPASQFSASGNHGEKKQRVIQRLDAFFERFFGLSAGGDD